MHLVVDTAELRDLVRQIVQECLEALNWPTGRLGLTEAELAASLGIGRHVLRDLRLAGQIQGSRIGKKIVYFRKDVQRVIEKLSPSERLSEERTSNGQRRTTNAL